MADNDTDDDMELHHALNEQENPECIGYKTINIGQSDNRLVTVYSVLQCIESAHINFRTECKDDDKIASDHFLKDQEYMDETSSIVLNEIPEKQKVVRSRHTGNNVEDISRTPSVQQAEMDVQQNVIHVDISDKSLSQSTNEFDMDSPHGTRAIEMKYNLRDRKRTVPVSCNESEDDSSESEESYSDAVLSEDSDGSEDSWSISDHQETKTHKHDARMKTKETVQWIPDGKTNFNDMMKWNAFSVCPVCKQVLKSRQQFVTHFTKSSSCKTYFLDSDKVTYRCRPCNYTHRHFSVFRDHIMIKCHGPNGYVSFPVEMCDTASADDLPSPPEDFRPGYKCQICGDVNHRPDRAFSHLQRHLTVQTKDGCTSETNGDGGVSNDAHGSDDLKITSGWKKDKSLRCVAELKEINRKVDELDRNTTLGLKEIKRNVEKLDDTTAFDELMKWNAYHVCPVCKAVLKGRQEFQNHLSPRSICRTYFLDKDGVMYRCKPCNYAKKTFTCFCRHLIRRCHGPNGYVSFPIESVVSTSVDGLTSPPKDFLPGYICQVCDRIIFDSSNAFRHLQRHEEANVINKTSFTSDITRAKSKKKSVSTTQNDGVHGSRDIVSSSDEADGTEMSSDIPKDKGIIYRPFVQWTLEDKKTFDKLMKWNAFHVCPVCKRSLHNEQQCITHFNGQSQCSRYFLDKGGEFYICRPCKYSNTSLRIFRDHLIRNWHGNMGYVSYPLETTTKIRGTLSAPPDDFRAGYRCQLCGKVQLKVGKGRQHLQERHTKEYVETWVACSLVMDTAAVNNTSDVSEAPVLTDREDTCKLSNADDENMVEFAVLEESELLCNSHVIDRDTDKDRLQQHHTSLYNDLDASLKEDLTGGITRKEDDSKMFDELMIWNSCHVCPVCGSISGNQMQFRDHFSISDSCKTYFRNTNGIGYFCRPCQYTGDKFSRLLTHLIFEIHGDRGRVSFPAALLSNAKDSTECSALDNDYKEIPNVQQKVDGNVEGNTERFVCDKDKTNKLSVSGNVDSNFKPGFCCQICGKMCNTRAFARRHLHREHEDINVTMWNQLECPLCKERFTSKLTLIEHLERHKDSNLNCTYCPIVVGSIEERECHVMKKHKIVKCRICEKVFGKRIALVLHEKIHTDGERPYMCDSCGATFRTVTGLWKHLLRHKKTRCPICDKLVDKCDLKRHKKLHIPTRPFGCDQCGKMFKQIHHLTNHLLSHTNTRAFKCHICGYAFNMKHHMKSHIRTKHINPATTLQTRVKTMEPRKKVKAIDTRTKAQRLKRNVTRKSNMAPTYSGKSEDLGNRRSTRTPTNDLSND